MVFLHTVKDVSNNDYYSFLNNESYFFIYLLNFIGAFAVPCFFMLSGAFILDNPKNADYRYFYKKAFKKIAIPTLVFAFIYFLYNEIPLLIRLYEGKTNYFFLISPLKELLRGSANGHLWYITVLIGIYCFIPFIVIIKEKVDNKNFSWFCWLYFIVAMLSGSSSSFYFHWSIGKIACYMEFVLVGFQIREYYKTRKSNKIALLFIFLVFIFTLIAGYMQFKADYAILIKNGLFKPPYRSANNFSLFVILSSIFIFSGFSKLNMENELPKLMNTISQITLYIYLIHRPFCELAPLIFLKYYSFKIGVLPYSILITLSVFTISLILTEFYKTIADKLLTVADK